MAEQKIEEKQSMPPPPVDPIDPERVEGAEERWEECPLKDCKRDPELLYADFYLRDIRTNRLMCSACATRTTVGYIAREVVKASDDRFFEGTTNDYLIVFFSIMAMSAVVNVLMMAIGFWFIAIFVGGAAGAFIGQTARRLTGRRVGRHSANIAVAAVIVSGIIAPPIWTFLNFGIFVFNINLYLNFALIIATGAMAATVYSVFMRRI